MKNFVITYRLTTDDLCFRRETNHKARTRAQAARTFEKEHPTACIIDLHEGLLIGNGITWDAGRSERAEAFIATARTR